MDFLRTLKKRKPKKHTRAAGDRAKPRGIRIRRRGTTLNLASCFAIFLGLAVVTQAQAEDYYIYQASNGALVISNKQLPRPTDRELPQAQEPGKPQLNVQTEGSSKPSNNK